MGTEPSEELPQGTHLLPAPPDESWFARLPAKVKGAISTAEFTAAFGCACLAWSLGGDMTLTTIALLAGWALGTIGIATVPQKSGRWKLWATAILLAIFVAEGGFLYWHFLPKIIPPSSPPIVIRSPPLLHEWADGADRTHLRGIFRNISRVLKEDISPVQADIPRLIEMIRAGLGHPLATQSLEQLVLNQRRLDAARVLFQRSYIVGSKYADEAWDALEDNADLYDVSTSLNRYMQIVRGIQEEPHPENYLNLLPDPEIRLRDANFKLGTWVEDCLRRVKAKQDALGD